MNSASRKPLDQIQKTSSKAEVIARHEPLIMSMADKFSQSGADFDDLCQEGRIALLQAFDTWRNPHIEFWSYARKFVLGVMSRIASQEVTRNGQHVSLDRLIEDQDFDAASNAPDAQALLEARESEEAKRDERELMMSKLDVLSVRQRQIVKMRFWDGMKFEAIADELKIDASSVHKTLTLALKRLREAMLSS